jgi:NDP-sugar pyrophosphorylase family protein
MRELIISAGGVNARLKDYLSKEFNGIPKHILPLPGKNRSLIEEIINNARPFFGRIQVHVNSQNVIYLSALLGDIPDVEIVVDTYCSGPVGPQIRSLLNRKSRVYGCAGDFYCDFNWKDFEKFHESHGKPVSILVAPSVPVYDGATFELGGNTILSWERSAQTTRDDIINIGCYIINYTCDVEKVVEQLVYHKEDPFFSGLIEKGLLNGYRSSTIGFNVNTSMVYEALCDYLK